MGNKLTVQVQVTGFESLLNALKQEDKIQINAMRKAHTKVGTLAVKVLKEGLKNRFGKTPKDKKYANSPKGTLPYMHTGALRKSIGVKVLSNPNGVSSKVGSGVNAYPIEYAKYLEGENHDGIRPFLWAISALYTPERVLEYFKKYYDEMRLL